MTIIWIIRMISFEFGNQFLIAKLNYLSARN